MKQSFKGSFLSEFNALMNGMSLDNERAVLEQMTSSFIQALEANGSCYDDTRQYLVAALDTGDSVPETSDQRLVQYSIHRTREDLNHNGSFESLSCSILLVRAIHNVEDGMILTSLTPPQSNLALRWYDWSVIASTTVAAATTSLRYFQRTPIWPQGQG